MNSFEEKTKYLKHKGWVEDSPMSFSKNGYEIFWDNSSSVEIYHKDNENKRLADYRIETIEELDALLGDLSFMP